MYAAKNDKYTLLMLPDDDAPNPREDCDCFGKMVCWHRRYNLGDDHDYEEPIDFLRDLYSSAVDDGGKRLVSFLKSRKAHIWNTIAARMSGICLSAAGGVLILNLRGIAFTLRLNLS